MVGGDGGGAVDGSLEDICSRRVLKASELPISSTNFTWPCCNWPVVRGLGNLDFRTAGLGLGLAAAAVAHVAYSMSHKLRVIF